MNEDKKYEVVKFIDKDLELDINVDPQNDTIWLTQEQIAFLYKSTKQNISLHLNNILNDEELDYSTVKKILTVQNEGNRKIKRNITYYNLDMVISIGYRVNSKKGIVFRKWANKVLKEYLLKGYVINENRVIVSNDNYIKLSNEVASINNRLIRIEDKVFDKDYNLNKIFFNGQFYDAYTLIQNIFESANNEIIIIDNYIDRTILDRLVVKKNNVNVTIYTNNNSSKILEKDINMFNKQYRGLNIRYVNNVHDRYIIIDKNKLYHLGHSIKDLGKKIFSIIESDNKFITDLLKYIS